MCYDPWEESIERFAQLYLGAVEESRDLTRTEKYRNLWAGRAEGFEKSYAGKLDELDDEDLEQWLNDIEEMYEGVERERLLVPAEKLKKERFEEDHEDSRV